MNNISRSLAATSSKTLPFITVILLLVGKVIAVGPDSTPADRGKMLLSDNLSHAADEPNWQRAHGKWESSDSALRGSELDKDKHGATIRRALSFKDSVLEFDVKLDGTKQVTLSIDDDIDHIARITLSQSSFKAQKDDHDHAGPDSGTVFVQSISNGDFVSCHGGHDIRSRSRKADEYAGVEFLLCSLEFKLENEVVEDLW